MFQPNSYYLVELIIFEQNDWAKLLLLAEIIYNNAKNASTGHMPFELNCGYHSRKSYKEEVNPRSQYKSTDKLLEELKELMVVYR